VILFAGLIPSLTEMRTSLTFLVVLALALAVVVGATASGLEESHEQELASAKINRLKQGAGGEDQSLVALASSSEGSSHSGLEAFADVSAEYPTKRKAAPKKQKKKPVRKPAVPKCPKRRAAIRVFCLSKKNKKAKCCQKKIPIDPFPPSGGVSDPNGSGSGSGSGTPVEPEREVPSGGGSGGGGGWGSGEAVAPQTGGGGTSAGGAGTGAPTGGNTASNSVVVPSGPLTQGTSPAAGCSPAWGSFTAANRPPSCWRPFSAQSPWNRRLPADVNAHRHENSDAIVQRLVALSVTNGGPDKMWWPQAGSEQKLAGSDYGHPIYFSKAGDQPVKIHCTGVGKCNKGVEGMQVLYPADPAALPAGGTDHHITFVDQSTGRAVDCWKAYVPPVNGVLTCDGVGWNHIDGDGTNGGGVAMNNGNLAGIVRAEELLEGRIEHALFMVVGCVDPEIVYPANHDMHICTADQHPQNAPASGQHFYLDYSDAEIDALKVTVPVKAFIRAMARYGAFVGDTGGNAYRFQRESEASYVSQGVPSVWDTVARKHGLQAGSGSWFLNAHLGVDWPSKLHVAHPCVARNNC
jgi:hypothetical protein